MKITSGFQTPTATLIQLMTSQLFFKLQHHVNACKSEKCLYLKTAYNELNAESMYKNKCDYH